MTYEEAIRFWFARVNYEHRSPKPSDLKLDRMRTLLGCLGNPQETLRIVHIAGSKGKGSTAAMLDAVVRQAGYSSGLFTSPHLSAIEERIQFNGAAISREELASSMNDVRKCVEDMDRRQPDGAISVTFFEIATALGFLHFARRRAEIVILEVGLGGRFDSTNVCQPALSIITSISIDHVEQLGNTLASIAFEKAGIVKHGRPVVSGARAMEAREVIERICQERNAPLKQEDRDFSYEHTPGQITADSTRLPHVRVCTANRNWPDFELGLLGEHQAANAAIVIAAIEELRRQGMHPSDEAVKRGIAGVRWPARLEVICRRPLVVLDCAHNVASIQALIDTLRESFPHSSTLGESNGSPNGRRLLVFASSGDKDLAGIIHLLAPHFDQAYMTRYTQSQRAAAPEQLAELWRRASDHPVSTFTTPIEAWQAARKSAGPDDLICVTGSVFLAGELRTAAASS